MLPVLPYKVFPALTDPDIESARNHVFEVQKHVSFKGRHYIRATLDAQIPIMLEYEESEGKLYLVHTPADVDVVHPALYQRLRPFFQYEGGSLHPAEAANDSIGEKGPEGKDAYFLPTFVYPPDSTIGPLIPYVFKQVIRDHKTLLVIPKFPTI